MLPLSSDLECHSKFVAWPSGLQKQPNPSYQFSDMSEEQEDSNENEQKVSDKNKKIHTGNH